MVPRWKQRLGGVFIATVGLGFTAWCWYTTLQQGYVYLKAAAIFPAFAVIGLALVAMPGYREERLARGEDLSQLSGQQLLTPRWWVVLVLALLASVGNWMLLQSRFPPP
jgi:hypothetical protein